MKILPTEFEGVHLIQPRDFTDARGSFVKTYHRELFRDAGIDFQPQEEFFSVSRRGVVRGMHFLLPPRSQKRLVYCSVGKVLDVVVDLRKSSKTFGGVISHELSEANCTMLLVPEGFAHGFAALADKCIMAYLASPVHSPAHDVGIAWDSIGFDWPVNNPVLSDRDRTFPALRDFASPF